MTANREHVVRWGLAILAATVGGVAGYFLFRWLCDFGLFGLLIPGAVLGLAGTLVMRRRSWAFGILCGIFAWPLGVFSLWMVRIPWDDEEPGFFYLLTHPNHVSPTLLIIIALGAVCAFWFGIGQQSGQSRAGD
jgi:uncharacterized membrane protein (UPF0136 family)